MKASQRFFTSLYPDLMGLGLLLIVWIVLSFFYPGYILPAPWSVLSALPGYVTAAIWPQLQITLFRLLTGFSLSLILGTLLGLIATIKKWNQPILSLMQAVGILPGTILGVLFLLMFGLGDLTAVLLVTFVTLPVLTINTIQAFTGQHKLQKEYLQSIRADTSSMIRYYYLPELVPVLYSNLSLGIGLAVRIVVLAEFIAAQNGLGYLINHARITYNMKETFVYLLLFLVFTLLFQAGINLIFKRFFGRFTYGE